MPALKGLHAGVANTDEVDTTAHPAPIVVIWPEISVRFDEHTILSSTDHGPVHPDPLLVTPEAVPHGWNEAAPDKKYNA
jgi:hypothetical protein